MPKRKDNNKTEVKKMDQESVPDNRKSDDEKSDAECSSDSEEESSDMDDDEFSRRRESCVRNIAELEKAFADLREQYCTERRAQADSKLEELRQGSDCSDPKYASRVQELEDQMKTRIEVAGVWRRQQRDVVKVQYDAEVLAAHQSHEKDKQMLYDTLRNELDEQIRQLEDDRRSAIHVQSNSSSARENASAGTLLAERQRRRQPNVARYEDGQLYFKGQCYKLGQQVLLCDRGRSPVTATIIAISSGEIIVKKSDGNKAKLYIAQLLKGKYSMKPHPS